MRLVVDILTCGGTDSSELHYIQHRIGAVKDDRTMARKRKQSAHEEASDTREAK